MLCPMRPTLTLDEDMASAAGFAHATRDGSGGLARVRGARRGGRGPRAADG
jgi:hypothetical protein